MIVRIICTQSRGYEPDNGPLRQRRLSHVHGVVEEPSTLQLAVRVRS